MMDDGDIPENQIKRYTPRQMREMRIHTLDHLIYICEKWIRQYRTEKEELQNKSDEDL